MAAREKLEENRKRMEVASSLKVYEVGKAFHLRKFQYDHPAGKRRERKGEK